MEPKTAEQINKQLLGQSECISKIKELQKEINLLAEYQRWWNTLKSCVEQNQWDEVLELMSGIEKNQGVV